MADFKYPLQQQAATASYSGGQRKAEYERELLAEKQRQFNLQLAQAKEVQRQNQQAVEQAQKDQLLRTQRAQETLDLAKEQLKLAQDKFKQTSDVELQLILSGKTRVAEEGETVEFIRDNIKYTSQDRQPRMLPSEPTQPITQLTETPKPTQPVTPAIPKLLTDKPFLTEEYTNAVNEMKQAKKPVQMRPKRARSTYQADRTGIRQWRTDIKSWEADKRKAEKDKRNAWNKANQKRIDILKEAGKKPKGYTTIPRPARKGYMWDMLPDGSYKEISDTRFQEKKVEYLMKLPPETRPGFGWAKNISDSTWRVMKNIKTKKDIEKLLAEREEYEAEDVDIRYILNYFTAK